MAAPGWGLRKENWTSLWKTSTAPAVIPPATGRQRAARSSPTGRSLVNRVTGQQGHWKSGSLETINLDKWVPGNHLSWKPGPWLPCHWKTRSLVTVSPENQVPSYRVTGKLVPSYRVTGKLVPGYHVAGKPGPVYHVSWKPGPWLPFQNHYRAEAVTLVCGGIPVFRGLTKVWLSYPPCPARTRPWE